MLIQALRNNGPAVLRHRPGARHSALAGSPVRSRPAFSLRAIAAGSCNWQRQRRSAAKMEERHKSNSQSGESEAARPALPLQGSLGRSLARSTARLPSPTLTAETQEQSRTAGPRLPGPTIGLFRLDCECVCVCVCVT